MPTAETRGRKPLPAGAAKTMFSLRLSTEARSILDRLSRHHGIDRTAVVEQELRRAGRRDGLSDIDLES